MSYNVPAKSPPLTLNGRTLCIAATTDVSVIGEVFTIGCFEKQADGTWIAAGTAIQYANTGDCLADMQTKGGRVKYLEWLIAKINTMLDKMFGGAAPAPRDTPPQAK